MLLSNNPEVDADELSRKLSLVSEHRRRAEQAGADALPAVQFEQEAMQPLITLTPAPDAPATEQVIEQADAVIEQADAVIEQRHPDALPDSPSLPPGVTLMDQPVDCTPAPASAGFKLKRKLKSFRRWLGNLLHLNRRLFGIGVELDRVQEQIRELENLRTKVVALEISTVTELPARIAALVQFGPRIIALEDLPVRIDNLEKLPAQLEQLRATIEALNELNRGILDRMHAYDVTNKGVEDRISWLEALKIGPRLNQLDQTNIANRLNRLDALDISNRLNAYDLTNVANRLHRLDEYNIGERLERLDAMLKTVQERNLERDNRIAALVQQFRAAPAARGEGPPAAGLPAALPSHADIDQFYVEFEGLFRGAPSEIRERLKVYLPYVDALAADPAARVVDIGCGRGEWLELLKEQGVRAIGIDMNAAMVGLCRERGLEAECTDAIGWLQRQPAGSVAMVTGFHLIEHLPFDTLLALFDAALHALRPDGMLIFETPNPENLVVGACHFYYDPTHRNPLVPAVAEFMARQRGFARAEILRLNAYPDSYLLEEDSEIATRVNRAFYGPQDFAVLAWKAHAD